MGQKIRLNERIEGINMGNISKKHAHFADDLWACIAADQLSIDELFREIQNFCNFTGLSVNYDKTQILRIGSLKDSDAKLITQGTISWSRRIKVLGMVFSADTTMAYEQNVNNLLNKIQKILSSWKHRNLTLIGKVIVINTLIMSQLVYFFCNTLIPDENFFENLTR